MGVMAAGVHDAGRFGFIGEIVIFFHRKSVDICPEGDAGTSLPALQDSHRAGAGDPVLEGNPHGAKGLADVFCGPVFLKGKLRVFMERVADLF